MHGTMNVKCVNNEKMLQNENKEELEHQIIRSCEGLKFM
jgi:hypothetical protein